MKKYKIKKISRNHDQYHYYRAEVKIGGLRLTSMDFCIDKYGNKEAKKLAVRYIHSHLRMEHKWTNYLDDTLKTTMTKIRKERIEA